jgi:hypothetical protein
LHSQRLIAPALDAALRCRPDRDLCHGASDLALSDDTSDFGLIVSNIAKAACRRHNVLSHQPMAQLDERLRQAILGKAGTSIALGDYGGLW